VQIYYYVILNVIAQKNMLSKACCVHADQMLHCTTGLQ